MQIVAALLAASAVVFATTVAVAQELGPVRCRQVVVASLGPENGFSARDISLDGTAIVGPFDQVLVSFTVLTPFDAELRLVQLIDDVEVGNWPLRLVSPAGVAALCAISDSKALSNCGALLTERPHLAAGHWLLKDNNARVLEAEVSFHICD
ncbi:MAG: hypothetical protein ACI8TX_000302 [Hyphomicrobiaceae bacterium]|jgi:hypothetical protein